MLTEREKSMENLLNLLAKFADAGYYAVTK